MSETPSVRLIRVFLSSPGDVAAERAIARDVITALPVDPLLSDQVVTKVIAWEDPRSRVAMIATLAPQEAIDRGLPKPSECDIVIVILWSRIGTPLDSARYKRADGSGYESGTVWEFENAMEAARKGGRPIVIVYRRTEEPVIRLNDPERAARIAQYDGVQKFFANFRNPDGTWRQSYNEYDTPETFRQFLENDLKEQIKKLLESGLTAEQPDAPPMAPWVGSPFPGLRAFTPNDAPIFYGRGHEIDGLARRVELARFAAVVGSSGSGKSSLVGAGLIPRLAGTTDWLVPTVNQAGEWTRLRCTPDERGGDPFLALGGALAPLLDRSAETIAADLRADADALDRLTGQLLERFPADQRPDDVLIFIDQFEELFSPRIPEIDRQAFAALLARGAASEAVRLVLTLRADYYDRCLDQLPRLTDLLRAGTFPLSAPDAEDLPDMITRPAARAGLEFEEGLVGRILRDMGANAGALPLLAYALDELYEARDDHRLTFAAYDSFEGVGGVIGARAEACYAPLDDEAQAALPAVFRALTSLDPNGMITRQRARRTQIARSPGGERLADALVEARLLSVGQDDDHQPTVEVAHEALFTHWPRLKEQLEADREFLALKRRLTADAAEWKRQNRSPSYLYSGARLGVARKTLDGRIDELNEDARDFWRRCNERERRERLIIGGLIGLSALISIMTLGFLGYQLYLRETAKSPMIAFAASSARLGAEGRAYPLDAFSIDQYEVSYRQYRLCMQAGSCSPPYETTESEAGTLPRIADGDPSSPVRQVTAYQASAFCGWLGRRLPTAAEWERAARGTDGRLWPWSGDEAPTPLRVNLTFLDAGAPARGPVAVDDPKFTQGATAEGVMHLIGNVTEWTATPGDCDDPYTCPRWDGRSTASSLFVRGFGWQTSFIPDYPMTVEGIAVEPLFVGFQDIGFRCAS